ncbi:MAG: tRNA (adenosine(37)-N6)-threonylcarbamoyltransferase complex ATPase subunit type 1 TsaE [Caldisericia bacterium]|nr:tRNA (adenosine(37)-N6)-threonylcarbamoyltransferase complex ATPase subunit type 1 TsaE [Caldisericia bacterium]
MKRKRVEIITKNSEETISLGEKLASCLKKGDIILLKGELGAGKSTLIKGIAKGLEVNEEVKSPSFIIVNELIGKNYILYHVDLYRIDGVEIFNLGLEEFLKNGIVSIEWADKIEENLRNIDLDFINIQINILSENERKIVLEFKGKELIERCSNLQ